MSNTPSTTDAEAGWARRQELFSRSLDLPEAERAAFVRSLTADDPALCSEVLELLVCDRGADSPGPLTQAMGAAIDAKTKDRRQALVGRVMGNYRLVSVLGHGGTGTVYLAERSDRQYAAQVAIKIIDGTALHATLDLRFRAERQILASLNHPNISRLIDAGETPEGSPYLVMEYVHGEPVDRYCDRLQLNLRARLELFLQICAAVQYAHQNLIVHRDLKPANVLVTAEGAPKLLDFGIAKLLDAGSTASEALTRMNDRLLTPEYASPEQILGRAVTTASDVYALGVVLYELLAGLRPYTVPDSASQLELERSICVHDPKRPSAALRAALELGSPPGDTSRSDIATIVAARGTTPDKLERRLQGDIDAIVMMALRKEPEKRYGSVEQLAADIRRHLGREPVSARQGTWVYYSERFVRRHAVGVSAAATFAVVVIGFAIAMSIQTQRVAAERDRATQERARAETVSRFMLDVFAASDPFTSQGREITAHQLLEDAGRRIRGDLGQQPEVRARLLEAIGRAYRRQNQFDRSISFLQEALHVRRQMTEGSSGEQRASVLVELSMALRQTGDLDAANRSLQEALTLSRSLTGERTVLHATLLTNLGRVHLQSGDLEAARQYFEESLTLSRELLGPLDPEVASILGELSNLFLWSDDTDNAERAAREAVAINREKLPQLHPDRVMGEYHLGTVLLAQNRMHEAGPLFEQSLKDQKVLYGDNSRQVADILDSLALIRKSQGQVPEAVEYARQAVAAQTSSLGARHFMTGYFRSSLAALLADQRKYAESENELRQALDIYSTGLPPDHQYVASAEHLLGEVLLATNRLVDAEAMLTAAMNRWRRTDAPEWRAARSSSALGEVLYRQGRTRDAERYLAEGYRTLVADARADRDARVRAHERLAQFYTDRGQREKLKELTLATRDEPSRAMAPN